MQRPQVAIIDSNTLASMGLKQLLQNTIPMMEVETFSSFEELMSSDWKHFFHYFVAQSIVVEHRTFFMDCRHKTIVLTTQKDPSMHLNDFLSLCITLPEHELVRSLLQLEQTGHAHGKNLPPMLKPNGKKQLSDREIEVLALIVQGKINKEIADQLNISLTTVISHRKNIMEKLDLKSVSALTIYAVTRGYVDLSQI
jgi:DNA-binding NarL/FixJ family response regulator